MIAIAIIKKISTRISLLLWLLLSDNTNHNDNKFNNNKKCSICKQYQ
jgi:hypothetical protein